MREDKGSEATVNTLLPYPLSLIPQERTLYMSIVERAQLLLRLMKEGGNDGYKGVWLQGKSGLTVEEVNDTIAYLENIGQVDVILDEGESYPFNFMEARISEG